MANNNRRIVITLNEDNYEALTDKLGTDVHEEVTTYVKDALIRLFGGTPELDRATQRQIDRVAKREAALAAKRAALAEAREIDSNALIDSVFAKVDEDEQH